VIGLVNGLIWPAALGFSLLSQIFAAARGCRSHAVPALKAVPGLDARGCQHPRPCQGCNARGCQHPRPCKGLLTLCTACAEAVPSFLTLCIGMHAMYSVCIPRRVGCSPGGVDRSDPEIVQSLI
jgi:hypothetical protein